jgi:hypothetical protein
MNVRFTEQWMKRYATLTVWLLEVSVEKLKWAKGSQEGIARVALEIGLRQAADLRRIRDVLDAGDDNAALALMREFFILHNRGKNEERRAGTE